MTTIVWFIIIKEKEVVEIHDRLYIDKLYYKWQISVGCTELFVEIDSICSNFLKDLQGEQFHRMWNLIYATDLSLYVVFSFFKILLNDSASPDP